MVPSHRKSGSLSRFVLFLAGLVYQRFLFTMANGRSISLSPVNAMMRTDLTNVAQPAVRCSQSCRIDEFLTDLWHGTSLLISHLKSYVFKYEHCCTRQSNQLLLFPHSSFDLKKKALGRVANWTLFDYAICPCRRQIIMCKCHADLMRVSSLSSTYIRRVREPYVEHQYRIRIYSYQGSDLALSHIWKPYTICVVLLCLVSCASGERYVRCICQAQACVSGRVTPILNPLALANHHSENRSLLSFFDFALKGVRAPWRRQPLQWEGCSQGRGQREWRARPHDRRHGSHQATGDRWCTLCPV